MGFSVFVEMLNLRVRGKGEQPVQLHQPFNPNRAASGALIKTDTWRIERSAVLIIPLSAAPTA